MLIDKKIKATLEEIIDAFDGYDSANLYVQTRQALALERIAAAIELAVVEPPPPADAQEAARATITPRQKS